MLRLVLVVPPHPEQASLVAGALAHLAPVEVYVAPALLNAARALTTGLAGGPLAEERLADGAGAVGFVEGLAAHSAPAVVIAEAEVVRAVVTRALDAPVPAERLALDPGAITEVEVRLDAPWTVSRMNDLCHLEDAGAAQV